MDGFRNIEEAHRVLQAQQGNREAFRALVEAYDQKPLYFIRRMVDESEEAFDVLQEVWLKVFQNLSRLRSPQAFRVWVYRIAHDQAVSVIRKKRKLIPVEEIPLENVPQAEGLDAAFESAERVHLALGALSWEHRQVITLRFLEEMSMEEIASVMGCGTGTAKSRLHYAKAAIGRWLEENPDV